jgi:hypothetical protein
MFTDKSQPLLDDRAQFSAEMITLKADVKNMSPTAMAKIQSKVDVIATSRYLAATATKAHLAAHGPPANQIKTTTVSMKTDALMRAVAAEAQSISNSTHNICVEAARNLTNDEVDALVSLGKNGITAKMRTEVFKASSCKLDEVSNWGDARRIFVSITVGYFAHIELYVVQGSSPLSRTLQSGEGLRCDSPRETRRREATRCRGA